MATKMKKSPLYAKAMRLARSGGVSIENVATMLEKARKAGDKRAAFALATWHKDGIHFRKDVKQAASLLQEAAEGEIPYALFNLAISYEKGQGLEKDLRKAFENYVRSMLVGYIEANREISRCLYYGIGVAKDRNLAEVYRQHWEKNKHIRQSDRWGFDYPAH